MWYKLVQDSKRNLWVVGIDGSVLKDKLLLASFNEYGSLSNEAMKIVLALGVNVVYSPTQITDDILASLPTKFSHVTTESNVNPNPPTPTPVKTLEGKRILLDPGHNERFVGARGKLPDRPEEEDFNRFQCQIIANRLRREGAFVEIYDPQDHDNLSVIGARAKGFDMFISVHLNALRGVDFYTTVMTHRTRGRPADVQFAKLCSDKIAKALNHKQNTPGGSIPNGVMPAALGVLTGAINAGCPVAVLTEAFFIDAYGSNAVVEQKCTVAANAIADAVKEWFTK
jgi:N-acetylmuramoyl-L-alanine amidase